jgi:hypothetical protein
MGMQYKSFKAFFITVYDDKGMFELEEGIMIIISVISKSWK